ncbi:MAG: PKD domain-containing protein [Candidatus Thermoplasmatota archaeon]
MVQPAELKKTKRPEFVTVSVALIIVGSMLIATFLIAWERRILANELPVADAGSNRIAIVNRGVDFDASRSYDPDGKIVNWTWDFGDGSKGYGETINHIYRALGNYTVTLTVRDSLGAKGSDSIIVTVIELVTYILSELLSSPQTYEDKIVLVLNATVTEISWYNEDLAKTAKFKIKDNSTVQSLVVYCEGYVTRPATLKVNDIINLQGLFFWWEDGGYWEIKLRRATEDYIQFIASGAVELYSTYNLTTLLSAPESYRDTPVRVLNATVTEISWYDEDLTKTAKFKIKDNSTVQSLVVYCEGSVTRPLSLAKYDIVNLQGIFFWYETGGYWEIKIRKGTNDSVTLSSVPEYALVTIDTLLYSPEKYENNQIRIENAFVSNGYEAELAQSVEFTISDFSATKTLKVIVEPNASRPLALTRNTKINLQGLFKWGSATDFWEILIRNSTTAPNATDKIELALELKYPIVTISQLFRNTSKYKDAEIRVENATVVDAGSYELGYGDLASDWVVFEISDNSTPQQIYVYCEPNATRPFYLYRNELVNVQGLFTYYTTGKYWGIKVRSKASLPETNDAVERSDTWGYTFVTVDILRYSPEKYEFTNVRVDYAIVVSSGYDCATNITVQFAISDQSTEMKLAVFVEPYANRPRSLTHSAVINIQGLFVWMNEYGWAILVRNTTTAPDGNDYIKVSYPVYTLVNVTALIYNSAKYEYSRVRVENAIVTDTGRFGQYGYEPSNWVTFEIADTLSGPSLTVYCEKEANRVLSLKLNDSVDIQGIVKWYSTGKYWEIMVRNNDTAPIDNDYVRFSARSYTLATIEDLLSNVTIYNNTLVRIENATVVNAGSYALGYGGSPRDYVSFDVVDSTGLQLHIYCERYAIRPLSLSEGAIINAQGEFFNYRGTWEIKVRRCSNDKVEEIPLALFWAQHVVISEVLYNPADSDMGKEWVELYNPTSNDISMSSWIIEHWSGDEDEIVGNVTLPSNAIIPGYGFYLIGWSSEIAPMPDYIPLEWFHPVVGLHNGAGKGDAIILKNESGIIIDILGYGNIPAEHSHFYEGSPKNISGVENRSLERKPGTPYGNGIDTNCNKYDFVESSSPNPQNSSYKEQPEFAQGVEIKESSRLRDRRPFRRAFAWKSLSRSLSNMTSQLILANNSAVKGNYLVAKFE